MADLNKVIVAGVEYHFEDSYARSQVGAIESMFENSSAIGINILDPANSESGDRSCNAEMTLSANSGRVRSINPIPIPKGIGYLYLRTSINAGTSSKIYIIYLDENGEYLKHYQADYSSIISAGCLKTEYIPSNCTHIHVTVAGTSSGHNFSTECISLEPTTSFEPFTVTVKNGLKESALPDIAKPANSGKVIVNFGDSIVGMRRAPNDISTELARLTGATVYNCGFGGCRMSNHKGVNFDPFSMYRLADEIVKDDDDETKWKLQDDAIDNVTGQAATVDTHFIESLNSLKSLDFNDVDIITIAYGTNDYTANVNMDNPDDAHDTTTFAGALRYSIEKLLVKYPNLKIFVCSQIFRFWRNSETGEITSTSDTHENTNGVKLTDFIQKTETVAKEYHLPFIDNYNVGFNRYNHTRYFSATDSTHPLPVGLRLIAANMAKELF